MPARSRKPAGWSATTRAATACRKPARPSSRSSSPNLATNLLKHGSGGEILRRSFDDRDGAGIELLALDRGAGMADVERCIGDGYSTAGSPGNGLGAVMRQSDHVRIYSRPGRGTAIMARFVVQPAPAAAAIRSRAPRSRRIPARSSAATVGRSATRTAAAPSLVADGSGHGAEAARAAEAAVRVFHDQSERPLRAPGGAACTAR